MTGHILATIGGVGLFLLGMLLLTEGLRGLAGGSLRRMLARFTRSPFSGAVTGAVSTAIVQSSSITTVSVVGFVGAGLLTFPQALGIVFGANIGTTITGWMVALLGFKLKFGVIAPPIIFIGVLMRLFGVGWLRRLGEALAGFGLIFVGIDTMQTGLAYFEGVVTPGDFPGETLFGRLQLVLVGVGVTVVTQSSSAGIAAAMVAMAAGAISFPQAAAMVIGMDVGTTMTAVLATVGGSTDMRRTGYAHVAFNLMAGMLAFFLLPYYVDFARPWIAEIGAVNAQLFLVGFHTALNVVGVAIALPVAVPFARFMEWLVPERGGDPARLLDERLLKDPAIATVAAAATVREILAMLVATLETVLIQARVSGKERRRLMEIDRALDATRRYVYLIRSGGADVRVRTRHTALLHLLDHLERLYQRCLQEERISVLSRDHRLHRLSGILRHTLPGVRAEADDIEQAARYLNRVRSLFRRQRHRYRGAVIQEAVTTPQEADYAALRLDGIRWLHRVSYHLWRILHHRAVAEGVKPRAAVNIEPIVEVHED